MSYNGEVLNASGLINIDLSMIEVIAVSGAGPNICGHLLMRSRGRGGFYFHIADIYTYPHYMDEDGFRRYLREAGKTVLRRLPISLPSPSAAETYLNELMAKKWAWGAVPNNCVSFVEDVIAAGGGTWASVSNCPSVATAQSLQSRVVNFLNVVEAHIYHAAGVPRY